MPYSPRFWSPVALSNPSVGYPTPPGAPPAQQTRAAPFWNPPRYQDPLPANPNMSTFFGVKAGDFGTDAMGNRASDFGGNMPADHRMSTAVGAGGGGVGGGRVQAGGGGTDLASQFQSQLDRANQANEARYQDILGGYQSRYERGLGMLAGLGQQEGRDVNELYDNQAAQMQQNLIGRGLGNSTVLDTMRMGNERERNADLGRLNDRVRQQAMSQDANLSGDTLQFMERKNENGPQMQLLAQLAQQLGQGGGGGGGGSGAFGFGALGMPSIDFYPNFGGYSPRGGTPANNARLAAARANYAAKNNPDPEYAIWAGTKPSRPVSSAYARSWFPSNYGAPIADWAISPDATYETPMPFGRVQYDMSGG